MPEPPTPPSPATTTVTVPPLTPPSSTGNRISTYLSVIPRHFARRNELRYSFPVVVLDTIWNLAFVVASAVMLILTAKAKPNVLFRVWLAGRMLNCVVYVFQMLLEHNRRNRRVLIYTQYSNSSYSSSTGFRFLRRLGVLYAFSFYAYWWNVGLIWMALDGETFKHDSPRLYWFTYTRGASKAEIGALPKYSVEVFNDEKEPDVKAPRMVCLGTNSPALSSVRVLQTKDSEGAPEADISIFPKYRFEVSNDEEQSDGTACRMVLMLTNGPDFSVEHALPTKDVAAFNGVGVPPPVFCFQEVDNNTKLLLQSVEFHWFRGSENEVYLIKTLLACSPFLHRMTIRTESSQVFGDDSRKLMLALKLLELN